MTSFLSPTARQPHRRRPAFVVLACVVILAAVAYGVALNAGWPPA